MEDNKINPQDTQTKQEQKVIKEKTYSQAEFDSAQAGLRRKYESEISHLKREPEIRKALLDKGCNKDAINHFIELNKKELFSCEQDKLEQLIQDKSEQFGYMFEKKPFVADPLSKFQTNSDLETKTKVQSYNKFFGK